MWELGVSPVPGTIGIPERTIDEFGHVRLGGIGNVIAQEIERRTGIETRYSVSDDFLKDDGELFRTLPDGTINSPTTGQRNALQLEHVRLQENGLEQLVDAGARAGRNVHEQRIATPVFRNDAVLHEVVAHPVDVRIRLVDLGDGHDDRHSRRPRRTRPPKRKTRITIYLDDEVLDEFRNLSERCGTGYQTLINAALRTRLAAAGIEPSLL